MQADLRNPIEERAVKKYNNARITKVLAKSTLTPFPSYLRKSFTSNKNK
tara:strand:+ start:89 stop:235 length:147 start_codon:yes stop_codon:yes gene_type:complete